MQRIRFVRELIKDYATIPALFLSSASTQYEIVSASEVRPGDLIGVTYFSGNSWPAATKARRLFPKHKIIVGGIGVLAHYERLLRSGVADYVYLGEGFDFDERHVVTVKDLGRTVPTAQDVDFDKLPLVRVSKNSYYFLIEKGCPYRCEYCYVSWANKFKSMKADKLKQKCVAIERKLSGKHITLVSNDGIAKHKNRDFFAKLSRNRFENQSLPLKMYLQNPAAFEKQLIVRVGVELPTEESRQRILPRMKQITDAELSEFLGSAKGNRESTLFYIYNYVGLTRQDYLRIVDIARQKSPASRLRLSFTSLEVQPYTALVPRLLEHIENILRGENFQNSELNRRLVNISGVKVFPPKMMASVLHTHLFTYLPHRYKLPSPRTGETAREFLARTKAANPGVNVLYEIERRAKAMQLDKGYNLKLVP